MATASTTTNSLQTIADLVDAIGGIPTSRIWLKPAPGTATERDVVRIVERGTGLVELWDGVLVEKPVGYVESRLAVLLAYYIQHYLVDHDIGTVIGPDTMVRVKPGQIRLPDVSFYRWERFKGRRVAEISILPGAPDLAVEVLSPSNTRGEMARKRREYFAAGSQLVWEADAKSRTVCVYTAPERCTTLSEGDLLEAGKLLPGWSLSIEKWFGEAEHSPGKAPRKRSR